MTPPSQLSQLDWIKAGFRALSVRGPDAVRVEALARDLGVTKGSFYWHFKDAAALRSAMLAHWADITTDALLHHLPPGPAPVRLARLAAQAADDPARDYGGPAAEAALRSWARTDPAAAGIVQDVDARRVALLAGILIADDWPPESAEWAARILHAALVGMEQLGAPSGTAGEDIARLVDSLTPR